MRQLYLLLAALMGLLPSFTKAQDIAGFTFAIGDNHIVHFTNTSTLSGDGDRKAYWSFGDGAIQATAALANTDHQYSTSGTYTVCLKIYKYLDNHDSVVTADVCHTVTLQSTTDVRCEAGFGHESPAGSALTQVFVAKPANSAGKKPELICWDFGDNHDTCLKYNPDVSSNYAVYHTYKERGLYKACVKITYQGGCTASYCNEVQVGDITATCSAAFRTETPDNHPLLRYFIAQPTNSENKKPELICWNFGDNHDTCIKYNPDVSSNYVVSHTYKEQGIYKACVKIQYQGGCLADYCDEVQVSEPAATCKAAFRTETGDNPLVRYLIAQPSNSQEKKPELICWDFGDNHDTCIKYDPAQSSNYVVRHVYKEHGIYKVCVKITYQGGCVASYCNELQVGATTATCSAGFRTETSNTSALLKYFIAQPSHSENKKPEQICWSFGDNHDTCIQYDPSVSRDYVVAHLYKEQGIFKACVKITYQGGCYSYYCNEVRVGESTGTCKVDYRTETANSSPLLRYFVAQPVHSQGKKPLRVCWSFGDGRDTCIQYDVPSSGPFVVAHRYEHAGRYEACVKVVFDGGCEAHLCKVETVGETPHPDTCFVNLHEVTTSSTNLERKFYVGLTQGKVPLKICWRFGDGRDTCLEVSNPPTDRQLMMTHLYPAPGRYEICARVWYDGGCVVYKCLVVEISPASTDICGGYMTDSLVGPGTLLFKGYGIQNANDHVISWQWSFGDGSGANTQQAKHTYASTGNYEVCLYIRTDRGCKTKICKEIAVQSNNGAQLVLSPNPVIDVLHAIFYSNQQQDVNIYIYNANGLLVKSYRKNVIRGANNWEFNVGDLPAGIYSVVVQSGNQLANAVFIKQ
jgi:PKD repeat protein